MKNSTLFVVLGLVGAFVIFRRLRVSSALAALPAGSAAPYPFRWSVADQEDADAGRSWTGIGALTGARPPAGATWSQSEGGWVERDAAGQVVGVYT